MTTKNNDSLIGFDPLAWISDDEQAPEQEDYALEQRDESDDAIVDELETEILVADVSHQESLTEPEINQWIDNSKIILDATLTINTVQELHGKLVPALQDNDSLEIDAANVKSIDTASLQLLVILKQEAFKLGKDIVFDFPSDKFIEAAELLGIDNMLGVDQAAAGFF
ncbi:MAG: STAS domain-containing protein [Methyloprofundus sp.]|nr:STAS domain-containing protein [Methyloprofundus sp.]MDT8425434.1 STAS domain-containing protein [Methyloprofundus sp.]